MAAVVSCFSDHNKETVGRALNRQLADYDRQCNKSHLKFMELETTVIRLLSRALNTTRKAAAEFRWLDQKVRPRFIQRI